MRNQPFEPIKDHAKELPLTLDMSLNTTLSDFRPHHYFDYIAGMGSGG